MRLSGWGRTEEHGGIRNDGRFGNKSPAESEGGEGEKDAAKEFLGYRRILFAVQLTFTINRKRPSPTVPLGTQGYQLEYLTVQP